MLSCSSGRVLVAVVVAMLCANGANALRCNGQEDNENCGSENMPESFCDASVFSSSLNEKLTEYTRQMCPVMCGTCSTTTSTTTMVTTWRPTDAVKVTPKQSVAIIGLCFAPLIVIALACYYKERRIPMSVMKHVMSESLEVAINRRLHAENHGNAGANFHRGPVRASKGHIKQQPDMPAGHPAPARTRNSRASVSSVESGDDVDTMFPGHVTDRRTSTESTPGRSRSNENVRRSSSIERGPNMSRPSFEYAKPKDRGTSKRQSVDMARPSGRMAMPPAHPAGTAPSVVFVPPSKPKIFDP